MGTTLHSVRILLQVLPANSKPCHNARPESLCTLFSSLINAVAKPCCHIGDLTSLAVMEVSSPSSWTPAAFVATNMAGSQVRDPPVSPLMWQTLKSRFISFARCPISISRFASCKTYGRSKTQSSRIFWQTPSNAQTGMHTHQLNKN